MQLYNAEDLSIYLHGSLANKHLPTKPQMLFLHKNLAIKNILKT